MPLEVVVFWNTLMMKARAVGRARLSGDTHELARAEAALKDYEQVCLKADRMIMPALNRRTP